MKFADPQVSYSRLYKKQRRAPRRIPAKRHSRRIKRVDVNPPEIYQSIANASAHTGLNPTSLLRWLDTGVFFGGVWESVDPPQKGIRVKVDGEIYGSMTQATSSIGVSRSAFSRQIGQGLKEFTVKGHHVEILE